MSAAAVTLISLAMAGCDANGAPLGADGAGEDTTTTTTTTTAQVAPTTGQSADDDVDYSRLLLQAGDLSDDQDTFVMRSTSADASGLPGASALFVNAEDTRAISDTVVIYPDAATATATLRETVAQADTTVVGTPQPAPVGTDGTMIVGMTPDGSKSATLLLFTEGPALARIKFESAPGDVTTDRFVISVGKMQQIALRTGLTTDG